MGPPIDPSEIMYHASRGQYIFSIFLGSLFLCIAYRRREKELRAKFLFSLGVVFLLTAPWIGSFTEAVIGAYPTIDKQGSLLFYLDGVHQRALLSPISSLEDPAYRLIGFHLGHFWIVAFFDIFVSSFAAYNAQMFLNLVLNLVVGILFLEKMEISKKKSLFFAVILGLQLHVFRDLHWYTIEKSALFWVFGFWIWLIELCKVNRGKKYPWWGLGIVYVLSTWINFYWGILLGILGFLYSLRMIRYRFSEYIDFWKGIALCGVLGLGISWIQLQLSAPHQSFATPEQFLERAILDSFTLSPLSWNRMGFWQAINPIILILGFFALKQRAITWFEGILALLFFLLSLGPTILGLSNPIYLFLSLIPGLWRLAKPEIFFLITYALLIIWAGRVQFSRKIQIGIIILMLSFWIIGLRTSKAYPYLTEYIPAELPENWEQRFFPN